MTNWIPLPRAAATVAAVLGCCLLADASAAVAFSPAKRGGAESAPLGPSSGSASAHSSTSAGTGGPSLVRTIVGLAIVIAVIWGLSWILRQFKAARRPQAPSGGLVSVAALTLSSGRSVHLVRAGNDYVLLGSAEQGVVPIQRYTEQQAREAGLLAEPEQPRSRLLRRIPAQLEAHGGRRDRGAERVGGGEDVEYVPNAAVDPMRPPSPSADLIARLRQWTVRR